MEGPITPIIAFHWSVPGPSITSLSRLIWFLETNFRFLHFFYIFKFLEFKNDKILTINCGSLNPVVHVSPRGTMKIILNYFIYTLKLICLIIREMTLLKITSSVWDYLCRAASNQAACATAVTKISYNLSNRMVL